MGKAKALVKLGEKSKDFKETFLKFIQPTKDELREHRTGFQDPSEIKPFVKKRLEKRNLTLDDNQIRNLRNFLRKNIDTKEKVIEEFKILGFETNEEGLEYLKNLRFTKSEIDNFDDITLGKIDPKKIPGKLDLATKKEMDKLVPEAKRRKDFEDFLTKKANLEKAEFIDSMEDTALKKNPVTPKFTGKDTKVARAKQLLKNELSKKTFSGKLLDEQANNVSNIKTNFVIKVNQFLAKKNSIRKKFKTKDDYEKNGYKILINGLKRIDKLNEVGTHWKKIKKIVDQKINQITPGYKARQKLKREQQIKKSIVKFKDSESKGIDYDDYTKGKNVLSTAILNTKRQIKNKREEIKQIITFLKKMAKTKESEIKGKKDIITKIQELRELKMKLQVLESKVEVDPKTTLGIRYSTRFDKN